MNQRATFALDEQTILRLKKLAALWKVSQAEVVRKAVERAEQETLEKSDLKIDRLEKYHKKSSISMQDADLYLEEVAEGRKDWGRDR